METVGQSLLLLGAVGVIAAIFGGNVRLPGGVSFGALQHPGLRWILAVVSLGFLVGGFLGATGMLPANEPRPVAPSALPSVAPLSDPGTAAKPAPPAPAPVAATTSVKALEAAYRKSANAACVESKKQSSAVAEPIAGDLEAIVTASLYWKGTLARTAVDLGGIEAPDALRSRHDSMVTNISEMSVAFGKAGEALQQGDVQTFDAAVPVINQHIAAQNRLATHLGLKDCSDL